MTVHLCVSRIQPSRSRQMYALHQHSIKSHNISSSFIPHHTLGTDSLIALPPACPWRDGPTFRLLFFLSFHLRRLCHLSLPHLPFEMNYITRPCKQSVDVCCCLATVGGESSRISVCLYGCVCTHVWLNMQNVTLRRVCACAPARPVLMCVHICR